jgi:hypothetical protein
MSPTRFLPVALLGAAALLVLGGCAATGHQPASGSDTAGFWLGLWHGLICPITFLVSLFDDRVGIYEVANNGHWYDFGFVAGVSIFFSGGARGAASASRQRGNRRAGVS